MLGDEWQKAKRADRLRDWHEAELKRSWQTTGSQWTRRLVKTKERLVQETPFRIDSQNPFLCTVILLGRIFMQFSRVCREYKGKGKCIAVHGTPSHSYGVSRAIWDHTVLPATRHKWTHPAFNPARHAGTRFTYPGGMEGWVNIGDLLHRPTEMVYPPADGHPYKY